MYFHFFVFSEEDDTSVFEMTRHKPRPRQSSQSGSDLLEQQKEGADTDNVQTGSQGQSKITLSKSLFS